MFCCRVSVLMGADMGVIWLPAMIKAPLFVRKNTPPVTGCTVPVMAISSDMGVMFA